MTPEENKAAEERLSIRTGAEEARRVARALAAGHAERSAKRAMMSATIAERERCLAIARMWPDNLMAKEIARRIQEP